MFSGSKVFKVVKNVNRLVSCFNTETGKEECFGEETCVLVDSKEGQLIKEAESLRKHQEGK